MSDKTRLGLEDCHQCEPHCDDNGFGRDLCSPPQALPPSMASFAVSPDNVMIYHTCDGGVLDRCLGTGIDTLTEWAAWMENTIVAAMCLAKESPCTLLQPTTDAKGVTTFTTVPVGELIAKCLGMSTEKPHLVYDAATKSLVAGKIDISQIPCVDFNQLLITCPAIAEPGKVPSHLLGYDDATPKTGKWYALAVQKPYMKFSAEFANADLTNKKPGVTADLRISPRNAIERLFVKEGSTFDAATSELTIGVDGLYQIDYSMMLNVIYQALTGWVVDVMCGLLITPSDGRPKYEIRTDERPMYLNYTAPAGQDIILQANTALSLKAGDKVLPRFWFNNTYIPSGNQNRTLDIWMGRSASCAFSVYRIPVSESSIGG